MSSISLGKFSPYKTFVHKLDPRVKLFSLILLMVVVFMPYNSFSMTFLMMGILTVLVFVLMGIAKVSFKSFLSSLKTLWIMMIILLLVYVFMPKSDVSSLHVMFSIGDYAVYWESLLEALRIFLRLILMIALSMVLTSTTAPLDLTYALEWYLTPLTLIGFPSHIIAMTISLALRFIPTILDDVNRIMKSQSSRGVDYENGSFIKKIKAIVSLVVPLFVSAFVRSDDLANAMECRGYDPTAKRTKYRKLTFKASDFFSVVVVVIFSAALIACSATSFDIFAFLGLGVI